MMARSYADVVKSTKPNPIPHVPLQRTVTSFSSSREGLDSTEVQEILRIIEELDVFYAPYPVMYDADDRQVILDLGDHILSITPTTFTEQTSFVRCSLKRVYKIDDTSFVQIIDVTDCGSPRFLRIFLQSLAINGFK